MFHDPGSPSFKNKKVSTKLFMKAMNYPSKRSASLIAVKFLLKAWQIFSICYTKDAVIFGLPKVAAFFIQ